MLVFWKERLVLLSVPKTGTTALHGTLAPSAAIVLRNPPGLKHMSLLQYRRFVMPMLGSFDGTDIETVAVVREPVSWLSSWYRYRHRDDLVGHPNSTRGLSFDDFVRAYAEGSPAPYAAVGSPARFVSDGAGGIGVTHLFRYEEPERLAAFLESRLGRSCSDLPRVNVSPAFDVTLSPEVEALLRALRPAEFSVGAAAGRGGGTP